ncbi:unnamed protein product, partial [Durusdinium trenchii]
VSGTAHLPDCAGVAARHLHVDPVAWSGQIVLQLSIFPLVRVLKTPLGNALLVGVGGSGRKSLATLGTFVAEFQTQTAQLVTAWATGGTVGTGAFEAFREMYDHFSIEITKKYSVDDWHEDARNAKLSSIGGTQEAPVQESFLEDTSSLLNNGEVPNLFNAEDKTAIMEGCGAAAQAAGCNGPAETLAFFTEQCRKNLHLILALSPIGEAFRRRVRMFPAIVNCCTIDWFMEWPQEALRSVATHFLQKVDLSEDVFSGVVEICVQMQESVFGLTDRFRREVQRHYYVTPTSYLELINSFKDVLASKRDEVSSAKRRYDDGLEKVISTEEQVKTMSIQLEELRPVLKQTSAETAELMTVIEHKQEEASATQAMVAKEEEAASQQATRDREFSDQTHEVRWDAEAARTMKEECQADLDKALPALNAALDALKSLKKSDPPEVKNMKSPPEGVITVSKALCWMFDVKPKKVTAEDGRTKIDDYWEPSKKSLWGDSKMLDRLLGYDKDHIPVEVIEKLKPLEEDPEFDPEVIRKASTAAMGICKWVRAMIVYDGVAKVVGPKKEALAGAEQELAKAPAAVTCHTQKRQIDNVAQLLADFESARKKKDDLAVQASLPRVDDCSKRLVRAEKLISGLGGGAVWGCCSAMQHEGSNDLASAVRNAASEMSAYSSSRPSRSSSEACLSKRHKRRSRRQVQEEGFTLEQQQKAVQDAAFERYIESLRKDARKAVTEARVWQETVKGGMDEEQTERQHKRNLCQKNQAQLLSQIENNKARRAESRREFIEAASSHSFPLFTETFISLPEVEEYERKRKEHWRKELDNQMATNQILHNLELKKHHDMAIASYKENVERTTKARRDERDRLAYQGRELVASWERDIRLKDLKRAMEVGKDVVKEIDSPSLNVRKVLIGSGIIAYLGTFTGRYRVDTVRSWARAAQRARGSHAEVQLMKDNQLPSAQEFSLRSVLGDEARAENG